MISIKTEEEIKSIRVACLIAAEVLNGIIKITKAGITTKDIDNLSEKLIKERAAIPVFKGYRGYKHATCISINEEVVHGIPGERKIKEGDIVGLDVGVSYKGFIGDNAATVMAGKVKGKTKKLVKATEKALYEAIKQTKEGKHVGDISFAIESCAKKEGFQVVKELFGHGVGKELHEDPLIPNFGKRGEGIELKSGMVIAIEPMLNMGGYKIETLEDGWTVVTKDRSFSAHFEHTVLINGNKPEILTKLR